jgi:DNA-binding CsgD family transcriptional regulator
VIDEKRSRGRRAPTAPSPSPNDDAISLPAPAGLRVERVLLDDEYLVLSFPIPTCKVPENFTSSERDVAFAVLRGEANEEIARRRNTSRRTVANQVAAIFAKVGVASRVELACALASSQEAARPNASED